MLAGRPPWLPDTDSFTNVPDIQDVGSRLAAAERDGLRPDGATGLGVLVGPSSLKWDVDPAALPLSLAGRHLRWLSLHANGANGLDSLRMGRYLLRSRLRPQVVVLALGPQSLATDLTTLANPRSPDLHSLAGELGPFGFARMLMQSSLLIPQNWACPNRTRVGRWVRFGLLDARVDLFNGLGYGLDAPFAPADDPWSPVRIEYPTRQLSESALGYQLDVERRQDVAFNPDAYGPDEPNVRNVLAFVRELRSAGSDVILVFMPEMLRRRLALPPGALHGFEQAMHREFGNAQPPVLDFRDAMPDDSFYDLLHLDPNGRTAFTERLGRALRDLSASRGRAVRPDAGPGPT